DAPAEGQPNFQASQQLRLGSSRGPSPMTVSPYRSNARRAPNHAATAPACPGMRGSGWVSWRVAASADRERSPVVVHLIANGDGDQFPRGWIWSGSRVGRLRRSYRVGRQGGDITGECTHDDGTYQQEHLEPPHPAARLPALGAR